MSPRQALGRGLQALLPNDLEHEQLISVPLEDIAPNPHQPRTSLDPDALQELADSIGTHGLLQPLLICRSPDQEGYQLIAGERRWRAAKAAGLSSVPAIIRDSSSTETLELALVENLQREDLNPIEEARAYRRLSEEFGLTHAEIAERVGKTRSTVSNALRLLKLPTAVQDHVIAGELSMGHARVLAGLSDEQATALLSKILNDDLTVRETEQAAKNEPASTRRSKTETSTQSLPTELASLESAIRERLRTKVKIKQSRQGGRITIYYYGSDDLERIHALFSDDGDPF